MNDGIVYGDYYLVGRLNTGGMAEVFLGKRLGADVGDPLLAIKRVLPQFSTDPEIVSLFEDEARIAQRLSHPNICRVHDEGIADKQLYLAMEYIHGKDLRVVAQRARKSGERLPYAISATIAAAIADALDYAHAMRSPAGGIEAVIHRDVSPQNILVSYDGIPKLIDFGIAKAKSRVVETRVGLVKGKYGYMSPEQATGGELDGRSDLFSLGCVLYELATGMEPFRSSTDVSTLRKVARASHAPASQVNASIPKGLAEIIETSLALEPSRRFANARAMADALRSFVRSDGENVTPEMLARTIRTMFKDDYPRERTRVEQYEALAIPAKGSGFPEPMGEITTEIDHSRTVVSAEALDLPLSLVAPANILAAGYSDDERTTNDDPSDGTQPAFETSPLLQTADDPLATTRAMSPLASGSDDVDTHNGDDEPTSAETSPHIVREHALASSDEAKTTRTQALASGRDANPWAGDLARTRTFAAPDLAALNKPQLGEGPTVVATPGFDNARTSLYPVRDSTPAHGTLAPNKERTPQRNKTLFPKDKTPARGHFVDDKTPAVPLERKGFTQEVTKEQRRPPSGFLEETTGSKRRPRAQLSQVLDALSPLATTTKVTPTHGATVDELARTRDVRRTVREPDSDTGAGALRRELADRKVTGNERTGELKREVTERAEVTTRVDAKEVTTRVAFDAKAVEPTSRVVTDKTAPDIVPPEARAKERTKARRDAERLTADLTEADDALDRRSTELAEPIDEPIPDDPMRLTVTKAEHRLLFSRGDMVTLIIAAAMGLVIMTVSYIYAANVPLPDDSAPIERVQQLPKKAS